MRASRTLWTSAYKHQPVTVQRKDQWSSANTQRASNDSTSNSIYKAICKDSGHTHSHKGNQEHRELKQKTPAQCQCQQLKGPTMNSRRRKAPTQKCTINCKVTFGSEAPALPVFQMLVGANGDKVKVKVTGVMFCTPRPRTCQKYPKWAVNTVQPGTPMPQTTHSQIINAPIALPTWVPRFAKCLQQDQSTRWS